MMMSTPPPSPTSECRWVDVEILTPRLSHSNAETPPPRLFMVITRTTMHDTSTPPPPPFRLVSSKRLMTVRENLGNHAEIYPS